MAGKKAKQRFSIAERRRKVAALYADHVDQAIIAQQLDVNPATISRDVAFIEAEWMVRSLVALDMRKARELAELDEIELDAATGYSISKNTRFLAIRLQCKERRARLLGLDAPARSALDLTGNVGLGLLSADDLVKARQDAEQWEQETFGGSPTSDPGA